MSVMVTVQTEPIDIAALQSQLPSMDCGAEVNFCGYVRQNDHAQPITHLFLQHYPTVTENEILRIIAVAEQRWQINHVTVVHRVGEIAVGEMIVYVAVYSKHRRDAYQANEFIMDYLKVSAPFWKKEIFADGQQHWVVAKQSDQEQFQQWTSL